MWRPVLLGVLCIALVTGAYVVVETGGTSTTGRGQSVEGSMGVDGPSLDGREQEHAAPRPPIPAATLIARLGADDPDAQWQAGRELVARLKAGVLSLDELLDLAVIDDEWADHVRRARKTLTKLGTRAAPLLPRMFEILLQPRDPEAAYHPVFWLLQTAAGVEPERLFSAPAHPILATAESRAVARSLLPRVRELLSDRLEEPSRVAALLPIIECLGAEAGHLAPLMIEWIREIKRVRIEYYRQHPNHYVCWSRQPEAIARAVTGMGPRGMRELLAAVQSGDTLVDYELRRALEYPSPLAADELRELAQHEDEAIRLLAIDGLVTLGSADGSLVGFLGALTADASPAVRLKAVWALSQQEAGGDVQLLRALDDPEADVRMVAASGLSNRPGTAAKALPRLLEMTQKAGSKERMAALEALTMLGPKGSEATQPAFEALVADLEAEPDAWPDLRSVRALAAFGTRAIEYLVSVAADPGGVRRNAAVLALTEIVPRPGQLRDLVGAYAPLAGELRIRMAGLSARAGDTQAVEALLDGLCSDEPVLREAALRAVTVAGGAARRTLPALVAGLRARPGGASEDDAPGQLRDLYVRALQSVGRASHPEMIRLLDDREEVLRTASARALVESGNAAHTAVLRTWAQLALRAKACLIRVVAGYVLDRRGELWAAWLAARLADPVPAVRLSAARAYLDAYALPEDLGTRVARVLIDLLEASDSQLAHGAADALTDGYGKPYLATYEQELRALELRLGGKVQEAVQYMLHGMDSD